MVAQKNRGHQRRVLLQQRPDAIDVPARLDAVAVQDHQRVRGQRQRGGLRLADLHARGAMLGDERLVEHTRQYPAHDIAGAGVGDGGVGRVDAQGADRGAPGGLKFAVHLLHSLAQISFAATGKGGRGGLRGLGEDSTSPTILILGSLALVESALIASAAFAVSIRRRQRELGLLAATGATPRQLASIVLLEAAVLGAVACAVGLVVGVAGVLAISPWLDELTQRRNPPLVLDLVGIGGPMLVGFLAAMIAAIVPARTVARVPVLLALSGRRPAQTPARRTLWLGLGVVALAAAMTLVGATLAFGGDSSVRYLLLIGGAVLSTLGFGACGPWLLERLDSLASRLPLAGRIAFRDTARARSRSSPIVTAILAGCAAAIALGAWQTSRDQESLAGWVPSLYADQVAINGPDSAAVGEVLRAEQGAVAGTSIPYLAFEDPNVLVNYQLPVALDDEGHLINLLDQCENCDPGAFQPFEAYRAAPATPEVLAMAGAVSSANWSMQLSASAGRHHARGDAATIAPHWRPATTIGVAAAEPTPISSARRESERSTSS